MAMLPPDLQALVVRTPVPPPSPVVEKEMEPMNIPAENATRPQEAGSALFPAGEAQELRRSWDMIQASFVDEPAKAVEDAERLIKGAVERLTQALSNARHGQASGAAPSTEDLRLTLKSYKALLGRLL